MLMAALSMTVVPVELKTPLTLMMPLVSVVTPLTVTIAPGSRLSVPLVLVELEAALIVRLLTISKVPLVLSNVPLMVPGFYL